jgi:hypothetical protein
MFVMEVTVLYGSLLIKEFHVMTDLDFVTIPSLWGLILFPLPCIKRNVVGAVNAVSCANMALAGVDYAIPCDEVIDAMGRVGSLLSPDLRETGQGGLAATPTGVKIARQLAQEG